MQVERIEDVVEHLARRHIAQLQAGTLFLLQHLGIDDEVHLQLAGQRPQQLPDIRIELNPRALFKYGIGLADVRAAVSAANGLAKAYPIRLQRLRIGEVELQQVEAIVGPDIPYILLGNTFLSSFRMERSNDIMRLERTR